MEASSAVNQPHPDATDEDAEDFFSTEEETAKADAPTDPDPATFDPETGDFTKSEGPPTLSPEQAKADAEEYAERTGAPLPESTVEAASEDETQKRQAQLRAIAERDRAAEEAKAAEDAAQAAAAEPEPEAAAEEPTPEHAQTADPTPPVASDGQTDAEKKRGSLEREYIVFQKVGLTKKVLEHLIAQIESGDTGGEPRVAFFELHRSVERNDKAAVADAYAKNKDSLGEKCELAAVSSRSFKERKVGLRPVTAEARLSIT